LVFSIHIHSHSLLDVQH